MRKNLRGRKATAIALASVMAMSLAACGKQEGSNPGDRQNRRNMYMFPNTWSWTIIRIPATVT